MSEPITIIYNDETNYNQGFLPTPIIEEYEEEEEEEEKKYSKANILWEPDWLVWDN